ncbi:MAG: riboflavin synthase [Desulfobacteraceae bacterium]|nr:riboflavin synthase [Desulfobacteraceae bacterium]MBC2754400.1 riboflavin synthase [Desulfobacteraceae bacterium]
MFTGIIEGLGKITGIRSAGEGKRFAIDASFALDGSKIGDSIAVNGACLTAVTIAKSRFEVDVSPETIDKTTLKNIKIGEQVNIERALRLSDRIDGHLVSGHIDGTGRITHKNQKGNAILVGFSVPHSLTRFMIAKGSVAIDGISLTINTCDEQNFEVSIIPHTAEITTIGIRNVGDAVNIETDMLGKYVEKFLTNKHTTDNNKNPRKPVDMEFLLKTGFI